MVANEVSMLRTSMSRLVRLHKEKETKIHKHNVALRFGAKGGRILSLQERAEQLLFEIRMQAMASKRSIQDKEALEYLLKKGEVYEPMPNFIRPVTTFNDSQTDSLWEVRQPKDKKKTSYEYLSFSQFYPEIKDIYSKLKELGGFGNKVSEEGYKYFLMAGGIGRRKE